MAQFYTYVSPAEIEAQFDTDEKKKYPEESNPYPKLDSALQTQLWISTSKWRTDWAQDVPRCLSPGGRTVCCMAADGEDFRTVKQTKKAVL